MDYELPYVGSSIVWEFKDVNDLNIYESSRRWLFSELLFFGPIAILIFVSSIFAELDGIAIFGYSMALSGLFPGFIRWFYRKKNGLTGIRMSLFKKHFIVYEHFGRPIYVPLIGDWGYTRKRMVVKLGAKNIKSAKWVSDGCWLDVWYKTKGGVIISNSLLAEDDGLAKFTEWCKQNRITIEGVPLLDDKLTPYSSLRESEGRRGL